MLEIISFYLFSFLIIVSLLIVVTTSNILYAMTALASGMIFISGIFFTLGAEFIGVVQIAAYTGAIMALYAFGMMFFDSSNEVRENIKNQRLICFLSVGISIFVVLAIKSYSHVESKLTPHIANLLPNIAQSQILHYASDENSMKNIGLALFQDYLIMFEVTATMLLISMVCGIALAKKGDK